MSSTLLLSTARASSGTRGSFGGVEKMCLYVLVSLLKLPLALPMCQWQENPRRPLSTHCGVSILPTKLSSPALCMVRGGVCTLWPSRNMLCLSHPCCFFRPRNFQAEIEAKELLLQQAVSHQAKLEADTRLLQGKEADLQGRLNHVMKVSETALDETSSLLQRWQSRGGDKYRWFTLLLLGRTGILCRRIISHIHTIVLNTELVTLP